MKHLSALLLLLIAVANANDCGTEDVMVQTLAPARWSPLLAYFGIAFILAMIEWLNLGSAMSLRT